MPTANQDSCPDTDDNNNNNCDRNNNNYDDDGDDGNDFNIMTIRSILKKGQPILFYFFLLNALIASEVALDRSFCQVTYQ